MTATKTILVTGAVGFIGTNLVEALLQRGDHVIALDAMDNYYDPALKATNLESLRGSVHAERLTFVQGDVRNEALIERLLRDHRFDAVAHLAALAGVRASLDEPTRYVDVNVNGTLVMLEAARHVEPSPNLVLASTSSVYGTSGQVPFVETDVADRPLAPYPASKRAAELMGHSYHHVYGLDFTALRLFTAYGPRNRPDMMAFRLLDSIFKGHRRPAVRRRRAAARLDLRGRHSRRHRDRPRPALGIRDHQSRSRRAPEAVRLRRAHQGAYRRGSPDQQR